MVVNAGDKKVSSLPFPAIVGQEELKRVLLAVAVDDDLDGALVRGEKGTAKSTAVRALIDLLPEQRAVADCPYGCSPDDSTLQCGECQNRTELPVETQQVPLVTLPLGATRDRIVGTLSVEDALAGDSEFDPGLLARAHRGFLYVDEVNLLEDHLVDVILDAAASGVNSVERDGVSVSHPAEFTLIGTMNPEEGELRPQLRDRFALQATVEGCREIDDRVEIIDRSLGFEGDASETYTADTQQLRAELEDARERLPSVSLPDEYKADIAQLCLEAGVDGHRGDVATARTARTLAALEGRTSVIEPDVREAAAYTLPHRLRSKPFEEPPDLEEILDDAFDETAEDTDDGDATDGDGGNDADTEGSEVETEADGENSTPEDEGDDGPRPEPDSSTGDDFEGRGPVPPSANDGEPKSDGDSDDSGDGQPAPSEQPGSGGRGDETTAGSERSGDSGGGMDGADADSEDGADREDEMTPLLPGHRSEIGEANAPSLENGEKATVEGTSAGSGAKTSPGADRRGARVRTEPTTGSGSIDVAASVRAAANRGGSSVTESDLRQSVRSGESGATIVFAVDASASMRPAMRTAKGVVLDLLRESYQDRHDVAFVAFAGDDASVLLPPTDSVTLAARHLKDLPSGDRTPLPAGLETARSVLERAETDRGIVVLVTDGGANTADGSEGPTAATRRTARELGTTADSVLVVDAGQNSRTGLSELVAAETEGELVSLASLSVEAVRSAAETDGGD